MKTLFTVMLTFCLALPASAQIIKDAYDKVVAPMDQAGIDHINAVSNIPRAGSREDEMSQEARYEDMTSPMNEAAGRHVDMTDDMTISEKEASRHDS